LHLVTRYPQRRSSRSIKRSTQQIVGIVATVGTTSSNPLIRRRKDRSDDLLMLRSGVKSITLKGTI
jgi:hypothetical protein